MNGDDNIQSNLGLRYMVAAIGLSTVVIVAIVVITVFRPEHDNSGIITIICTVGAGTYPGVITFIKGQANSEEVRKIKAANDKKAEEVRQALLESQRKLTEANDAQRKHLEEQDKKLDKQDAKLETVVRQTNGLLENIKEAARKEGQKIGEQVALAKLGKDDQRATG